MRKHSNVAWSLLVLILLTPACGPETPASPAPARTAAPTNTGAQVFTVTPIYTSTARPPITDSASTSIASPTPFGGSGKIVFVSCDYKTVSQDGLVFERTDDDSCEIYVMNADGSDPTQIMISGGNSNPVWPPDGTRIIYARNREGSSLSTRMAAGRPR